jgi:hypothetical protein
VEADTKYGCPVYESHYLVQMLDNFKYLYVVLAFVIGLVECFYGHKIFKPTLFLVIIIYFILEFLLISTLDRIFSGLYSYLSVFIQYLAWNSGKSIYKILGCF